MDKRNEMEKHTQLVSGLRTIGCLLLACLVFSLIYSLISGCSPIRHLAFGAAVASMVMAIISTWHTVKRHLNIPTKKPY